MSGMGDRDHVRSDIRAFICKNFLVGEAQQSLNDSTLLLTTGIVSSLATLELVAFLEEQYDIELRQDDLSPERLDSVELILALVDELRGVDRRSRGE